MERRFNHRLEQQSAPAFFVRGPSPLARLAFFSALSLALMAADSRLEYLTSVRQSLQGMLHPLQLLANAPSRLYRDTTEYFSTHQYLLSENRTLKQTALKQSVDLQKLNALELENNNLRQLLQINKSIVETSVAAEIMHVGRDLFTKKIIVNRGATHNIVAGEAVVDATGVIGQVTRIYPLSSEVTLITDKSLAIPIQVERNGLRAIAFGHGRDNTLDLPYLPTNVDIQHGDKLVTSGIDGVYPAGLAVATVSQIEVTPDSPFARIICVPTGRVENHKQVLLVSIPAKVEPVETEIISPIKQEAKVKRSENTPIKLEVVKPEVAKPEIAKPAAIKAEPEKIQLPSESKPALVAPPNNTSKPHAAE
ncbi:MAG: rod shape-determining protein MreC [Methylotenera sp.]|uniref:rod shape-determining protein MreC n=1 Tax=Methylotenera sp. TaxID=2051956 RepID=UPI002488A4EB|nr:rod shape-determining protein MreC [Methylotenera sp.]MDI1308749.1 rod shape-determining protein MreC [Methylotenera sp.]